MWTTRLASILAVCSFVPAQSVLETTWTGNLTGVAGGNVCFDLEVTTTLTLDRIDLNIDAQLGTTGAIEVFATTSRGIGHVLWRIGDALMIDSLVVNGSAKLVGWISGVVRRVQTGYLSHYAFAMISGLILLLGWAVLG